MTKNPVMFLALILSGAGAGLSQSAPLGQTQADSPQTSSIAVVHAEVDPAVPNSRLLRIADTVHGNAAGLAGGPATVHFALYAEQAGGEALWSEVQQIEVGRDGSFQALLGASTPGGLPASVFQNGNARWLTVAFGEADAAEQPRLMLVGVPYALEAADAQTLGGLPASAFARAADVKALVAAAVQAVPLITPESTGITTTGGTLNYVAKFTGSATIANSEIFDNGTNVGIGTNAPSAKLDVSGTGFFNGALGLGTQGTATTSRGYGSWPLTLTGSIYSSTATAAVSESFQWQVAPFENDTAIAQDYLQLNFVDGTAAPKQILAINSIGQIAFAPGQYFPGVAGLPLANDFTATQTVTGVNAGVNATATAAAGTGVNANGGGYGVFANGTGANGVGVFGSGNWGLQAAGKAYGVYATSNAPFSTGVYGASTGSGETAGVWGDGAFGVFGIGTINGVFGRSNSTGATGVQGIAPGYGIYGTGTASGSTGIYGTAPGNGVYGVSTGNGKGVYGAGFYGVYGSGTDIGVYGTGAMNGVYGTGNYTGVFGSGPSFGLEGTATGTSGVAVGVYGSGIYGMEGTGGSYGLYAATPSGTAGGYGVYGARSKTGSSTSYHVCSSDCTDTFSGAINVLAKGGIWADTDWDGDATITDAVPYGNFVPALLVTADKSAGAVMLNTSNEAPTLMLGNNGSAGVRNLVLTAQGRGGACSMSGGGDVACTGSLKALANTGSGTSSNQVETYAVQSAENWSEDAGTAHLVNGVARVKLDAIFAQTVNTGVEYHVFLTPDGDCRGLYLSAKDASGFEVRELGGGSASIAFEYRIMAKRMGHEEERLVNVKSRETSQISTPAPR